MKTTRLIAAGAAAAGLLAMSAASASAAPTGQFADFKYCPYGNPAVTQCLYSVTSSGAIKLGNQNVPINRNIILQGGIEEGDMTTKFYDAVGAPTLSRTPLDVPGGLIGIVSTGGLSGALLNAFYAATQSVNGVTAIAEQVGPVQFSLGNLLTAQGTAVELPIRVKLENPFLGDNCYIGSASTPVRLKLTTGTTAPPAPTAPITGAPGTLSFSPDFAVVNVTGTSLVDNAFAAPKASGCGFTFIDRPLISAAVNAKIGLPAAAGKSSARLNGNSKLASASGVAASSN